MSRCGVAAVMPSPYRSATSRPSCSTTSASVQVPPNTSAAVAVLPSVRLTGGSGSGPSAAGSGDPPPGPAGIGWLGVILRLVPEGPPVERGILPVGQRHPGLRRRREAGHEAGPGRDLIGHVAYLNRLLT